MNLEYIFNEKIWGVGNIHTIIYVIYVFDGITIQSYWRT